MNIEFRGKRTADLKWVYGGYHYHEVFTPCIMHEEGTESPQSDFQHLIIESGFSDWNMPKPINAMQVDAETVGQFTGLLDKNGKKIFQGDIISFSIFDWQDDDKQYTGVVTFEDGAMIIKKDEINWHGLAYIYYQDDEMKIIGNIHDNPELLEVAK